MVEDTQEEKLFVIESDEGSRDYFAEIAGVIEYKANGQDYVNFAFLSNKVEHLMTSAGQPATANVTLKKIASVTMTLERAMALQDILNSTIEEHKKQNIKKG
ncbi:Uncharacterised protein [Serratia plymuthica]|uniref:hypothetical protein n=1 Tax=Serratia plymuthica TaxID=82996 RepID=UPI0021793043|nr:hypothetical protein [Serratia plymuthica]CAI0731977.1 Uncharacterised protein [Serratia plymuthica]